MKGNGTSIMEIYKAEEEPDDAVLNEILRINTEKGLKRDKLIVDTEKALQRRCAYLQKNKKRIGKGDQKLIKTVMGLEGDKTGTVRSAAIAIAYYDLEKWIEKEIRKYGVSPEEREDFCQEAYLAIIEGMPIYNPEYRMSTFFCRRIENKFFMMRNDTGNGYTKYQNELNCKIAKVMSALNEEGNRNLTETEIANRINMENSVGKQKITEKQVRNAIRNQIKTDYMEDTAEIPIAVWGNPEQEILKNEQIGALEEVLAGADPIIKKMIVIAYDYFCAENKKISKKKLLDILNEDREIGEELSLQKVNKLYSEITDMLTSAG